MDNFDPTKVVLPTTGTGLVNINRTNLKIGEIIVQILPFVFGIAAILLLIYLVTAGLSMMLSRGDPKAMQGAQDKIKNALIGFVIVIMAFFIVQLLGRVFGLQTNLIFSQIFGVK